MHNKYGYSFLLMVNSMIRYRYLKICFWPSLFTSNNMRIICTHTYLTLRKLRHIDLAQEYNKNNIERYMPNVNEGNYF